MNKLNPPPKRVEEAKAIQPQILRSLWSGAGALFVGLVVPWLYLSGILYLLCIPIFWYAYSLYKRQFYLTEPYQLDRFGSVFVNALKNGEKIETEIQFQFPKGTADGVQQTLRLSTAEALNQYFPTLEALPSAEELEKQIDPALDKKLTEEQVPVLLYHIVLMEPYHEPPSPPPEPPFLGIFVARRS